MHQQVSDFITLFNTLWYRDFPVIRGHESLGKRAVWTTHIASVVKQSADMLGFFTCFESGGRTDAVIQTGNREVWAKIEWEWMQPRHEKVNEFEKFLDAKDDSEVFIYVGYSRSDRDHHDENLQKIEELWRSVDKPLIVFLITFSYHDKRRHFHKLQTHLFEGGKRKPLRNQNALPWEVEGSKWAVSLNPTFEVDAGIDKD